MKIGLVPNINKGSIVEVVGSIVSKLDKLKIEVSISDSLLEKFNSLPSPIAELEFMSNEDLFLSSDFVISIGGDGTMLNTAYHGIKSKTPLAGINFGKLGFLAEFDMSNIDKLISDLLSENYEIEKRMVLYGRRLDESKDELFAINDIVIDKGRWPKMIEISISVDGIQVSTFAADGIIIATPTGSTGYSLSTGGPIVSPVADAITLCPIAPHTLTMRPLVLSDKQKITLNVNSQHTGVQVNCDGQRVYTFKPPLKLDIQKSKNPIRLVHTKDTNYFEILRNKLYWGLDVRNSLNN